MISSSKGRLILILGLGTKMRASIILTLFFSSIASAEVIQVLDRRLPFDLSTPLKQRSDSPASSALRKRQFCPPSYGYCVANNGDAVCQSVDEVCCQVISTGGSDPFTCPLTHPYCCPPDPSTGILVCGSDESCGSGDFFSVPPAVKATETTGMAGPTRSAGGNGGGSRATPSAKKEGGAVGMDRRCGAESVVAAALVALVVGV
ncbi:hypothetical protein K469DRAFT_785843 [Zopfia rhizophila CBS 207.26]|uniref:Uncharacterized protein n=1 Tax=Zopfia rhizophila CBS 207.26 TaxID=1314779 RepID=A0A6A6DUC7_9PEZI|nr:hypothetical protein K469DRAFT_785843 [Zopfia rhizophila CBS 207.26]